MTSLADPMAISTGSCAGTTATGGRSRRRQTYDAARLVFPGGIDIRPAAIVRPRDAAEVARIVTLARDSGPALGGPQRRAQRRRHGVVEDGIVPTSATCAVEIDVEHAPLGADRADRPASTRTPRRARPRHRLRRQRLGRDRRDHARRWRRIPQPPARATVDGLLAAEIVTADGEVPQVDAERHPDLFWAIRGGGGNFGVATRFKFRLHEVGGSSAAC